MLLIEDSLRLDFKLAKKEITGREQICFNLTFKYSSSVSSIHCKIGIPEEVTRTTEEDKPSISYLLKHG